jgi:hypothetical protein
MEPLVCPRCGREQPETAQSHECLFCGSELYGAALAAAGTDRVRAPLPPVPEALDADSDLDATADEPSSSPDPTGAPPEPEPLPPGARARKIARLVLAIIFIGFIANANLNRYLSQRHRRPAPVNVTTSPLPTWPTGLGRPVPTVPVKTSSG